MFQMSEELEEIILYWNNRKSYYILPLSVGPMCYNCFIRLLSGARCEMSFLYCHYLWRDVIWPFYIDIVCGAMWYDHFIRLLEGGADVCDVIWYYMWCDVISPFYMAIRRGADVCDVLWPFYMAIRRGAPMCAMWFVRFILILSVARCDMTILYGY